jgi:hypothetical protein
MSALRELIGGVDLEVGGEMPCALVSERHPDQA